VLNIEVREARFIGLKLFLAVFGRCMFICVHSVLLLDEMELHVCLGVDLGGFRHCMWVDSGELCYSRPSELVSPRRGYQNAHPGPASSTRSGEGLHFWATGQLAQARQRRLSEKS